MKLLVAIVLTILLLNVEEVQGVRSQWIQQARATSEAVLTVRLALHQQNLDVLEVRVSIFSVILFS